MFTNKTALGQIAGWVTSACWTSFPVDSEARGYQQSKLYHWKFKKNIGLVYSRCQKLPLPRATKDLSWVESNPWNFTHCDKSMLIYPSVVDDGLGLHWGMCIRQVTDGFMEIVQVTGWWFFFRGVLSTLVRYTDHITHFKCLNCLSSETYMELYEWIQLE